VKVDQVVGNNVSSAPFQRTIVCLNPRRESRLITLVTNVEVVLVTNVTVVTITNLMVTMGTNTSRTLATNVAALPPATTAAPPTDTEVAEGTQVVVTAPPNTTNETVTTASNLVLSKAPNQSSFVVSVQTQLSRQVTVSTNNISITAAENETRSFETNQVLTLQTNLTVVPVTNVVVTETNLLLRDYFLYTEVTPPPDFVLAPGESLVLLVDGVRHGFAPATSGTVFVSRKGYLSTLYRVPPELLVDIANAREVKVRIRGVNSVIERTMNTASRNTFKKFLAKYFVPENASVAVMPATRVAAAPPSEF
jgi:hypothetical protein